jgi:hypothetical protein
MKRFTIAEMSIMYLGESSPRRMNRFTRERRSLSSLRKESSRAEDLDLDEDPA